MKHIFRRIALLMAILICLSAMAVSFAGCGGGKTPPAESESTTDTSAESVGESESGSTETAPETAPESAAPETGTTTKPGMVSYTIRVQSAGGIALEKATVAIYADEALQDLENFGMTNADGIITVDLPQSGTYRAVITTLPEGYTAEASYALTGTDTTISIASSVIPDTDITGVNYKLGSIMHDFTYTDHEGNVYQLSELLKEKKAVVLNFWATWCGPCVSEFPAMSAAYENHKGSIEILALDPDLEDTVEDIAQYKADSQIPFPMIKDSSVLASSAFAIAGYPTTVVIDRYGMICFIYSGALPNEAAFDNIFSHFSADDYKQQIITDLAELVPQEKPNVTMPSSEDIAKALGYTNATFSPETNEADAEHSWPFIISEKDGKPCVVPANSRKPSSFATMYITISLKKGEALAFDYYSSTEAGNDNLYTLAKRDDIGGDTYKDVYQISGNDPQWSTCYTFVANEDGVYSIGLCYIKDSTGDVGDDTVYIRNLRVVPETQIDVPAYIPRYAANDLKEDHSGYNMYATVVYNEKDGYYHVGNENGPLLLADLMKPTRFSQTSIYSFALDGQIVLDGKDYLNDLIPYASYASNSNIAGLCPVNQELRELLEVTAAALGLETDNQNQWLQMCSYYDAYGTNGVQLEDPTRGLYCTDADNKAIIDSYRAYTAQLGENAITYNRLIMPRGLLSKFVPETSGAYRITSKSDYLVEGWIFTEDGNEYFVYEGGERLYSDANNVSMVVYMEAGTSYYIDICYYDVYGTGTINYDIEFLGESYQQFHSASPGFFTFPDGSNAGDSLGSLAEILAGGIDVILGEDGYYHEKLADGSAGSIIYADFTYTTGIFSSDSLQSLADKNAFDFTKSESDEYILGFIDKHGDNTQQYLMEYWGEQYEELAAEHKLEDVLNGKMHGVGSDMTDDIRAYFDKIITSTENPELDGCVPVDAELAEILQKLLDKYTFAGVDHSWTKVCYYYRQLG